MSKVFIYVCIDKSAVKREKNAVGEIYSLRYHNTFTAALSLTGVRLRHAVILDFIGQHGSHAIKETRNA